jgi:hypothetical protein
MYEVGKNSTTSYRKDKLRGRRTAGLQNCRKALDIL